MTFLDRTQDFDDRFTGVVLQRAVLLVARRHFFGRTAGAGGEDFEKVRHPRLVSPIEVNFGIRISDGPLELLHDHRWIVVQVDDSSVTSRRFRHLRRGILEIGNLRAGFRSDHLWNHERGAETGVEPLGDIACDLDVLALVLAHRYVVGVVEQDVGCLKRGVGEQAS